MELDNSNLKICYTADAKPLREWMMQELERIARSHGEDVSIKFTPESQDAS